MGRTNSRPIRPLRSWRRRRRRGSASTAERLRESNTGDEIITSDGGTGKVRDQLAAMAGVGSSTISQAKVVVKASPHLASEVMAGRNRRACRRHQSRQHGAARIITKGLSSMFWKNRQSAEPVKLDRVAMFRGVVDDAIRNVTAHASWSEKI